MRTTSAPCRKPAGALRARRSASPRGASRSALRAGARGASGLTASLLLTALAVPAALAQDDGRGIQINTDALGRDLFGDAGNEPSIGISPVNERLMVIGWRQFPTVNSDARYAGLAYSVDGGENWFNIGPLAPPPGQPLNSQQTDPLIDADNQGVFYYWNEIFRPNPPTKQFLHMSFDGGITWPQATQVENPAAPGDKEWFVIDKTGGIGEGHIYGGWNHFDLGGHCFVRSTDGGMSFSRPVRIADASGTQWMLQFAVGPEGEVYAAWRNDSRDLIYVTKSTRAKNPADTPLFDAFGSGGQYGLDLVLDVNANPGFTPINPVGFNQLYIDVDRSNGVRRGWVYALFSSDRRSNDPADIAFARSEDGGFNWVTGIRVNDDPANARAYQWMPAMAVAPNGRIDAAWYDTRNDLSDPTPESQLTYSYSINGGDTWAPNRILTAPFDTTVGYPSQEKIGDYIQGRATDQAFHLAYAATFNGGQDVFFKKISPLELTVSSLRAGQNGTFRIDTATPNGSVWLTYSTVGTGTRPVPQLNATLGILNPMVAGTPKQANAAGEVEWILPIPANAGGATVWFQAIQVSAVSDVERVVIAN